MAKKTLLLGHTGKMGIALEEVLSDGDYEVIGKSSRNFDAEDFDGVRTLLTQVKPEVVINTVAFLGIDGCEKDPMTAISLNTLYPKFLAELSNQENFLLMHFSTDAVFSDLEDRLCGRLYVEGDSPRPLNMYGLSKYGGDCFVQAIAERHYIIRIPVLFGKSVKKYQFVEKMLQRAEQGNKTLWVSDDIISSPSYSLDVANECKRILGAGMPYGVYHVANEGRATLFELMQEIVQQSGLDVKIERASYKDFPYVGIKNTNTPITSEKLRPLRHWKDAVKDYADRLKEYKNGRHV